MAELGVVSGRDALGGDADAPGPAYDAGGEVVEGLEVVGAEGGVEVDGLDGALDGEAVGEVVADGEVGLGALVEEEGEASLREGGGGGLEPGGELGAVDDEAVAVASGEVGGGEGVAEGEGLGVVALVFEGELGDLGGGEGGGEGLCEVLSELVAVGVLFEDASEECGGGAAVDLGGLTLGVALGVEVEVDLDSAQLLAGLERRGAGEAVVLGLEVPEAEGLGVAEGGGEEGEGGVGEGGVEPADAGGEGEAEEGRERVESFRLFAPYFEARGHFRLDPEGRAAKHTHWSEDREPGEWTVAQMLVDYAGINDWEAVFGVSLEKSRAENRAVVRLEAVRAVGMG